jgi:ABC-type multidrug transport system fused ATPase/permease subunit
LPLLTPRPDSGYGYNRSAHFPWKPEVQRRTFQLYSDEEVIKGIDLGVNAGETVAIVGSTGAGKSTIINLLNRFYEIDSGEICIDNQNIERYTLVTENQIAVVLQDVFLCRHGFQ